MAKTKKGEESRAAAVGRKRPQTHDPVSAYKPDKRQKLDEDDSDDENYMPLDFQDDSNVSSGHSKESGEVSASAQSSRRSSKASAASKRVTRTSTKTAPALSPAAEHLKGIDVDAIYPEALQTHVQEQMALTGYPAENVLDEMMRPNKQYGKQARDFTKAWQNGYCSVLGSYPYHDLKRLVQDPNSFAKPLDLGALGQKKPFNKALQEVREKHPDMPPRALIFELIKTRLFHQRACRILGSHLLNNPCTVATESTSSIAQLKGTNLEVKAQAQVDLPGGNPQDPISLSSPASRTASPHQSSSASEGEVSESEADAETSSEGDDDDDMYGYKIDGIVCLSDLSVEEQALQYRYFHLSDPGDSVHCLSCGERGHMQARCPALTCQHCHSNTHFSRGCPSYQKCERCRDRGHNSKNCTKRSRPAGAPGDECDICGVRGHAEEECAGLWMTFKPDPESINKIPAKEMVVSCYNCGAKGHWGDDCSKLPDYVFKDIMHATWSAKNASKYIIGAEEKVTGGKNGINGTGSVQAHQLAQLGDWI